MESEFSTWSMDDPAREMTSLGEDSPIKAFMGWGGIILHDDSVDVVDMAREYAARARAESCGQCFPCRMGSVEISAILERICAGQGKTEDLSRLETLARYVRESSRCDIGKTFPKPILDALEYFSEKFASAIKEGVPRPKGHYVSQVTAPCISACPARVDIPGYVEHLRNDRWQESLDLARESCCLPGTLGRVCVRFCELNCRRGSLDDSVSIKALKRFAADMETTDEDDKGTPSKSASGRKATVAIVGAGPAGLACAYYLGLRGYASTIFEALDEPGGMAAMGIPDYRLPRAVLRAEAARAERVGAEIRYGVKVGKDVTIPSLFDQGYRAVFIGAGAPGSASMRCEGEDAGYEGFMPGVEFLRRIAIGEKPLKGRKMVVIGGGNVAMDCVRSALRQGFDDVNLLYRRTEKEMPADRVEIEESKEEGVKIQTLAAPVRILAENGKVTGVECIRMTLGEPDESGRRRPIPEEGSNFVVECDAVVPAIGQVCEVNEIFPQGLEVARNNTLVIDPMTMRSSDPRIFGGGDCVTGPATLVAALGAGRRSARFIIEYLEKGDCKAAPEDYLDAVTSELWLSCSEEAPPFASLVGREYPRVIDPETRIKDFDEVEGCLTPAQVRKEAKRCLRCYRIALGAVA